MQRRDFLRVTGLATGAFLTAGFGLFSCLERRPPNIVFIMADDLGWRELGCYGQEKIQTPHIDRLAAQGMKFTQFYSGSAVCAPARCTLMTGMHGGHAYIRSNFEVPDPEPGVFGGQKPLPAETLTVAETLKQQGYTTGAFGKWGLGGVGSSGDPLSQGFDRFYGYNCQRHAHNLYPNYLVSDEKNVPLEGNTRGLTGEQYGPQRIADEMLQFVRDNRDRPFFLYYPTVIPHLALQVPEEYLDRYRGRWPETPYTGNSYLPHPTPRAAYAAMISFLDDQVGRLMDLLGELGLDENTIVFFTSDNGTTHLKAQVDYEFFDSVGPLWGLKGSLYEGGIREPLIVRWPGRIPAGTTSDLIAAHYDTPATLAALARTDFSEHSDGISILPTLLDREQTQARHEYLLWDFAGYGGQLAVRMGKWKGVKQGLQRNPDAPLELYNLEEDIGEQQNVANQYPEVAARIEQIMLEARTVPEVEEFRFGRYL